MKLKYDISMDEIRVDKEPEATAKILPFPKDVRLPIEVHIVLSAYVCSSSYSEFTD